MRIPILKLSSLLIAILLPFVYASAILSLSPIFRSNMVLQRGTTVPVFGTANAGAMVTVQFNGQNISTIAGSSGTWRVDLSSMPATTSAITMIITSGTETISFTDVQVGEVWICSGQSNMGWPLNKANGGSAAIADAANHNIRLFRMTAGNGPATANWVISNSTTSANFSAVGYWMGLELSQWFGNVPIGLIQATHDGTAIEHWQHSSGGIGDDYDAMIRSIQPFAVRGVAWYQGESNGGDAQYASKLTNMINEWRTDWGQSSLPFGIIQLAYRSGWNVCRNAQLEVADALPECFLVVIRDLPGGTLHPTEKKPVGIRTAIGARGLLYGDNITYSGPVRDIPECTVVGNKVIMKWKFLGGGLITSDGKAPGDFKLATATGQFKNANAVIVGNTVEVTSSFVSNPARVQYSYSTVGNLYNIVNIPTEGGLTTVTRLKASEFQINVSPAPLTTHAASELLSENNARKSLIYPNPSNGYFSIETGDLSGNGQFSIEIFDLAGRRIYKKTAPPGNVIQVKSKMRPGTYILRLENNSKILIRKLLIQ